MIRRDDRLPLQLLEAWIDESYQAVAPKRLLAELGVMRQAQRGPKEECLPLGGVIGQPQDKGKGQRKLTEEQYDRFLADYDVGDYGEAVLDAGENRLTVRNRFKAAAKRRGLALEFRRTGPGFIRFRVMPGNGHATEAPEPEPQPEPEPEPVPTEVPVAPKRRGGRPKKTSA